MTFYGRHQRSSDGEMMSDIFPVIASILCPQALRDEVLPGFGIGEIVACEFYSGGFNHTYQVKAGDRSVYYLRAYRRGWRTQCACCRS